MQEKFLASVQYDDFKGTSAADMADQLGPKKWLQDNGHAKDGDFLVGISVYTGENYGKFNDPVAVEFLIAEGDHDSVQTDLNSSKALPVRSVNIDMPISDFLALFKRFKITLSSHGMLEGKPIRYTDIKRS